MLGNGAAQKEALRPDFNRSIFIDFFRSQDHIRCGVPSDAGS